MAEITYEYEHLCEEIGANEDPKERFNSLPSAIGALVMVDDWYEDVYYVRRDYISTVRYWYTGTGLHKVDLVDLSDDVQAAARECRQELSYQIRHDNSLRNPS